MTEWAKTARGLVTQRCWRCRKVSRPEVAWELEPDRSPYARRIVFQCSNCTAILADPVEVEWQGG